MCDYIFMIFKGRKVLDGTLNDIQSNYGANTIRLRLDGDCQILNDFEGIEHILDHGQFQEVSFTGDAQKLLQYLVAKTQVKHFELAQPSLHDIFLRIAGPDAQKEEADA